MMNGAAGDVGHHHGLAGDLVEVLGHHVGVEVGVAARVGDHHHLHRISRPFDLIGEGGGMSGQGTHSDQGSKEGGAECFSSDPRLDFQ